MKTLKSMNMKTTLRAFALTLLAGASLMAQQTFPSIGAYTLTSKDCDPLSMLMLFRPQGFVCEPAVYVVISGMGPEVIAYQAEIVLQASNGQAVTLNVVIPVLNGEAKWVLHADAYKVLRVSAVPLTALQTATTSVF